MFSDALRIFALSLGFVMFGLTIAVLHAYFMVWRKAKSRNTGILPFHVWTIAASHCLAISFMCAEVFMRLSEGVDLSWRSPVFIASSTLGIMSLVSVLRYELQRKRRLWAEEDKRCGR